MVHLPISYLFPGLEAAILETQKVLRNAVTRNQNGNEMSSLSSTDGEYRGLNVDTAREKIENLVSKGSSWEFKLIMLSLTLSINLITTSSITPQGFLSHSSSLYLSKVAHYAKLSFPLYLFYSDYTRTISVTLYLLRILVSDFPTYWNFELFP